MSARLTDRHPFALWLAAATSSTLGDTVAWFAIGWVAAGHGAGTAGLVLTVEGVPLFALILVGGVLADRFGVRRVMLACVAAMTVVAGALALLALVRHGDVPVPALLVVAVLAGTGAALRRPADGVFPRLFFSGDELARRMATVSLSLQAARLAGPAVAGLLLAAGGLALTSGLDALSFVAVLVVLLRVRPPLEPPAVRSPASWWRQALDGLRAGGQVPGARPGIAAVVGLAATVLPLVSLLVPLLGHRHGWSAGATGLVAGGWVLGGMGVAGYVARRGRPSRRLHRLGAAVAAVGAAGLAVSAHPLPAVASTVVVGVGTALVTSRLVPALMDATPPELLARFSALLGLAQTGPVLILTPVLGAVAAVGGPSLGCWVVAALLLVTTGPVVLADRRTAAPADGLRTSYQRV